VNDTYVRQYIAQVISSVTAELEKEKIKYIEMMARLKNLEVVFDTENDGFDIYVRQRGMKESLNKFNEQLKENRSHQSEIQNELKKLRKELKALPNQKEVEEKYVEFTRLNIIKLDAWNPAYDRNIRLLTPIKAQGTLENKIILAQFVGLFQTMEYFKTRTIRFPFVVDSPRGKEASQESSKNILSMIADISMLPQVILATIDFDEYKDTIGETAKNANIITLQKRNRLLEKDDYTAHEAEIAEILELLKGNL
jgi:hypothetical protein